jgi:hypothetical protein
MFGAIFSGAFSCGSSRRSRYARRRSHGTTAGTRRYSQRRVHSSESTAVRFCEVGWVRLRGPGMQRMPGCMREKVSDVQLDFAFVRRNRNLMKNQVDRE